MFVESSFRCYISFLTDVFKINLIITQLYFLVARDEKLLIKFFKRNILNADMT